MSTAVLAFLAGLLPLFVTCIAYRTVLLISCWKKHKTDHITPLFQFLRWLPIQQRIQYEINTLCYKYIMGTAPSYLCDCVQLYTPSASTVRSASNTLSLQIPHTRLSTVGAFSVFGPSTWSKLPLPLQQKPSLDSFKCKLKTFLFPKL